MTATLIDVPPGLRNVAVTQTHIGEVRGEAGFYHYRQYSAIDLAERCSLEEVWHLLLRGHLPERSELASFTTELRSLRTLPSRIAALLPSIVDAQGPQTGSLDGLRSALSLAASNLQMRPCLDLTPSQREADALQLCAIVPTLLAALHRLQLGLKPLPPTSDLGHTANYLYMLSGKEAPEDECRAVEQYLISTIDHGFNASTFAARVVAGTGADMGACLVAAIGALSGPLHGGAPSRALEALDHIGTPDRAASWVRNQVSRQQRIMGFGHAVYRTEDPRSAMLKRIATELGGDRVDVAIAVESEIVSTLAELKPDRALHANVEYFAGVVMERCGLPPEMFTPTFAASRVIGWAANILEQAAEGKIIRPAARYVGQEPPVCVPPLAERCAS